MSKAMKSAIIIGIIGGILSSFTSYYNGQKEYKRGFIDGYQSRIDYEHGKG